MVDATYGPKVYRKQGGNELVVANGGKITVESGGEIDMQDASIGGEKLAAQFIRVYLADGQNETSDTTIPVTGVAVGDRVLWAKVYATKASIATQTMRAPSDFTVTAADEITVGANAANNANNQYEFGILKAS